jgi:2-keto-3-deoxy-L-rhamnonate aldolase RhmA
LIEVSNEALERLRRGEIALGMNVRHSRTSEIAWLLKGCGYHWVFMDDEHSPIPVDRAYDIGLTAMRIGLTPCMRVRTNQPHEIARHLSNGAMGIIVPHVESAEEAECAARACRFPPRGDLSVPGAFPQFGYPTIAAHEATRRMNDLAMVVVMIESGRALEEVEAIAAVEGVDVLFIGLHDLTHDLGLPGQYGHPRVLSAIDRVVAAAGQHGRFAGIGGVKENAMWADCVGRGVRFLLAENDLTMLAARAAERAAFFNGLGAG